MNRGDLRHLAFAGVHHTLFVTSGGRVYEISSDVRVRGLRHDTVANHAESQVTAKLREHMKVKFRCEVLSSLAETSVKVVER